MKNVSIGLVVLAVTVLFSSPAQAADENVAVKGAKKVGTAIAWPFKKMGEGVKACGNGVKKTFKKDS